MRITVATGPHSQAPSVNEKDVHQKRERVIRKFIALVPAEVRQEGAQKSPAFWNYTNQAGQ